MKKLILNSIVSMMALIAVTLPAASLDSLDSHHGASLEGAWDVQVTSTDCNGNTLITFRVFEAFHEGGTETQTGNLSSPALTSIGIGTWQRTGMRTFNSTSQGFNFNPDGSFAGTSKVERQIHLSAHGNSFTSTATLAVYDPDGNLIFSGCGTDVATRLR